jgi:hypothetical protein
VTAFDARRAAADVVSASLRAVCPAIGTAPSRWRIRATTCGPSHTRAARICRTLPPDNRPRGAGRDFRGTPTAAHPGFLWRSGRLDPPQGVDGTSSSEHSRQRPGDGESPGVLSGAKITPEPPEERRSPGSGG